MRKILVGIIGIAILCVGLNVTGCHGAGDLKLDGPNYEDIPVLDPGTTTESDDDAAQVVDEVEKDEFVCVDITEIKMPSVSSCSEIGQRRICEEEGEIDEELLAEADCIREKFNEIVYGDAFERSDWEEGKNILLEDIDKEDLEDFDVRIVKIEEISFCSDFPADESCFIVRDALVKNNERVTATDQDLHPQSSSVLDLLQ